MPLRLTPSVSILLPGKNPYQASEVDPYLLSGLSKNSRIRSIEQINKSNSSMSLLKKQDKKYLGRNGGETQEYGLEQIASGRRLERIRKASKVDQRQKRLIRNPQRSENEDKCVQMRNLSSENGKQQLIVFSGKAKQHKLRKINTFTMKKTENRLRTLANVKEVTIRDSTEEQQKIPQVTNQFLDVGNIIDKFQIKNIVKQSLKENLEKNRRLQNTSNQKIRKINSQRLISYRSVNTSDQYKSKALPFYAAVSGHRFLPRMFANYYNSNHQSQSSCQNQGFNNSKPRLLVHNPFPKQGNNIQGQFCKQRSIEPINWKGSKKAQLDFNNDLQLSGPEFVSGDKISGIDEEMMRVSHIPYKSMVDSHLGIEQQGDLVKMLEML